MTDQPLRAACIHGRYEAHRVITGEPVPTGSVMLPTETCPGGREVIIDIEAAKDALDEWLFGLEGVGDMTVEDIYEGLPVFVAAAIGDTV